MLPQILPGADRLVTKATQSSQPVRNREWKASTDVGRVCTAWQQELADLAWLLIEVGLDEALVVDPDVDVQEVDTSCLQIVVKGELDRGVKGVAVHHELLQLLLRPLPDKEDVIYEPPPEVDCCSWGDLLRSVRFIRV